MEHIYNNIKSKASWPYLTGKTWSPSMYEYMVNYYTDGAHFVQIGPDSGKTAAYMAVELVNKNKNIQFDCIDTWNSTNDDYYYFLENIKPIKERIHIINADSIHASCSYEDNSLDFIYIDVGVPDIGINDYYKTIANINAWYPKLKKFGHIGGYGYFHVFPWVVKAVDDFLIEKNINSFYASNWEWVYHKR